MVNLHKIIPKRDRISLTYLFKWLLTAIIAGLSSAVLVHSFIMILAYINTFLQSISIPLFIWPVAGALLVGGIIYRLEQRAAGEGIPSYIRGLQLYNGKLPFSVTFYKFWAVLITLGTFGNGGIVGPLGRVSAGILSAASGRLISITTFWTEGDRRTATICGLAATIGTIFHTPIGGGIFAVEIIQKTKMGYKDLFPSILASSTAVFFCKTAGWKSFYQFNAVDQFMDTKFIGWLLLLALIAGGAGGVYTVFYSAVARLFRRGTGNCIRKVVFGSLLSAFLVWLVNPELLGTSNNLVPAIFGANYQLLTGRFSQNSIPLWLILVIMSMTKAIGNCITVGCGMNAGFTGPAAIAGLLLGMAMAQFLNIPVGIASYDVFLAVGFCAFMASSMNIPLAAAIMTIELFGLQYSFPAGFSAIIGFQVTRHRTIYEYTISDKSSGDD